MGHSHPHDINSKQRQCLNTLPTPPIVNSPTKTLPPSLRHPDYNQQSQSHFALCTVNNITTGTVNTPLITEANKPETHQEVIHPPYSKQWELAA